MRKLFVSLFVCCCVTAAYAQETVESTEVTTEVSSAGEENSNGGNDEVAVGVDSYRCEKSKGGCGCGGKPKI